MDCSAEEARAFLNTPDGTERITRNSPLLKHILEVLRHNEDTPQRSRLIRSLESGTWKAERLQRDTWNVLLADTDVSNRLAAYGLAARFGPERAVIRGLADVNPSVRLGILRALAGRERSLKDGGWPKRLEVLAQSAAPLEADAALIALAAHGFTDIALPLARELSKGTLGTILAHAGRLVENANVAELSLIVELTLSERYHPFAKIAPEVLAALALNWRKVERAQQQSLLAFAVHHSATSVRASAVALAQAARSVDMIKFLLADPSSIVREAAWHCLLEAEPQQLPIDADALLRLLVDARASTDLRIRACGAAKRHQVTEAVNALKEIADDRSETRDGKTLGEAARAALLTLWPESATWINARLERH
jgi:hypothetical protein